MAVSTSTFAAMTYILAHDYKIFDGHSCFFVYTSDITVVMAPGIQIDNETPEPEDIPQCIIDDYDKIKIDTEKGSYMERVKD